MREVSDSGGAPEKSNDWETDCCKSLVLRGRVGAISSDRSVSFDFVSEGISKEAKREGGEDGLSNFTFEISIFSVAGVSP